MNDDFTKNQANESKDPDLIPCRRPVRRASRDVGSFSEKNTKKESAEIKVEKVPVAVLEKLLFDQANPKIVEEALLEQKRAEEAERARREQAQKEKLEKARAAAQEARLEQARIAAAEQERQAQARAAAAAEQERLAQARAAAAEQERLAQARAAAAEQERLAQARAAATEQERQAQTAQQAEIPAPEQAQSAPEEEKTEKISGIADTFDWIKSFLFSLTVVIFVFTLIFRGVTVNGGSMLPTLENNDYLIISDLFYTPKTGDIVVVQSPHYKNASEPLIKRIIATGGQTVKINFNTWEVWVDGELLEEDYILKDAATSMHSEDLKPDENGEVEVLVERNCVFVMGDHRNDSLDSRSNSVGQIDQRYIMGRVLIRLTPLKHFGKVD